MCLRTDLALLLTAIVTLSGCGLDNTYEEKRKAANDISGNYVADNKGDGALLNLSIEIENEFERHDVAVFIDRDKLSTGERGFYTQLGVPLTEADKQFRALGLGVGRQSWLKIPGAESGDNVSQDKGKTSRLVVCSNTVALSKTYYARYCMTARYVNASRVLSGTLTAAVYLEATDITLNKPFKVLNQKFVAESLAPIYE